MKIPDHGEHAVELSDTVTSTACKYFLELDYNLNHPGQ